VLDIDFTESTAIFVYLVPKGLNLIAERLQDVVKKGGRVVSYIFSVPGTVVFNLQLCSFKKIK
jgi:hypothetical protein